MRSLLVLLIVFGSLPITLVRPYVGVLMWTWIGLMSPHRLTWGVAQIFPSALAIGVVTIVGWIMSREPKRIPMTATTVLLVLLTGWFTLTTVFAVMQDDAWTKWNTTMKVILFTFIMMSVMRSERQIKLLVLVATLSIGFYGIRGGVFTIVTGGNYRVFGPPGTFIGDNNALALALIMILPLFRYLQLYAPNWWLRLGFLGGLGLTFVAIIGTYSRGAMVGMAAMLLFLWLKSRQRFVLAIVFAGLIGGGLAFMPAQWMARMNTINDSKKDDSAQGRLDAWLLAIKIAQDSPIVGGGFKVSTSQELWAKYRPGKTVRAFHSVYFEMLGGHGFVGLAIFLMLGISTMQTGRRIIRMTRRRPELTWARDLAAMIQVGLVGYAVAGAFLNLATFDLYYTYIAILVMLERFVSEQIEAADQAAAEPVRDEPVAVPEIAASTATVDHANSVFVRTR